MSQVNWPGKSTIYSCIKTWYSGKAFAFQFCNTSDSNDYVSVRKLSRLLICSCCIPLCFVLMTVLGAVMVIIGALPYYVGWLRDEKITAE